jgi:hypothetical protein
MDEWLILISSLPSDNTSLRTKLWRILKSIGAHALRDGVYLLPDVGICRSSFESVRQEVVEAGGTAWVLEADQAKDTSFRVFFDRKKEYAGFLEHLTQEQALKPTSPADAERVIRRLQKEFDHIESIDYFKNGAHAQAASAIAAFANRLRRLHSPDEPHSATCPIQRLSVQDFQSRTWATRKAIWVDRMACAWLIKRFIDKQASFLWLNHPSECPDDALGFDFDGARFTHIDSKVSFEVLIETFDLQVKGLPRLAHIVHCLDVGGIPVAEAPGVERTLAGLRSQAQNDDQLLAQVSPIFDALLMAFQNDSEQPQP